MCCTWFAENTGCKNLPSAHHRTTFLGYMFSTKARIDNWKKNLLNTNISCTCPHNMTNFGPLVAEIGWRVWGTPANFNGFRVLASLLLSGGHPSFAWCLAISWAGTLYIRCWGLLLPNGILSSAKLTLCSSSVFSYIGAVTARHSSSGHWPNFAAFSRGHHLYLAGQPSCWASDHILVIE